MRRAAQGCARLAGLLTVVATLAAACPGLAQDGPLSWKDAQSLLRAAQRDTLGHANEPAALDSLASALFRVDKLSEAEAIHRRALELSPERRETMAGLGKVLLMLGRTEEAARLLEQAAPADGAEADLYLAKLRLSDWRGAAALAEAANDAGRVPLLTRMAEEGAFRMSEKGPQQTRIGFQRLWPVPLVRAKINGHLVVLALDPASSELLLDPASLRIHGVERVEGERGLFWNGSRVAVKNGWVRKLDLGGIALEGVPCGVLALQKYSLAVNPQGRYIQGVLGMSVLKRFGLTIDMGQQRLELRRPGVAYTPQSGPSVPFEWWGEHELTVYGSLAGGRRMAMLFGTGLPEAGVGLAEETASELGLKSTTLSRWVKGAGVWLQGRPWAPLMVPTVAIGSVVQDKVPGWSGALDTSELWRHGARRDALLGPDALSKRRITFDWSAQTLRFEED